MPLNLKSKFSEPDHLPYSADNASQKASKPARIKLLAIDDELGVLDMIRGHFELRGFEIATASDGPEGIQLCAEFNPDVILLDLKMRTMDGDRAFPELRRLAPNAKIIVVSAYQDDVMQRRIAGLGVDAYFEKPVSIIILERSLREMLKTGAGA